MKNGVHVLKNAILLFFLFISINSIAQYCKPSGANDNGIERVEIGELFNINDESWNVDDNPLQNGNRHYYDRTSVVGKMFRGRATQILAYAGYSWGDPDIYHAAFYVDWNNNGSFEDANELIDYKRDTKPPFLVQILPHDSIPLGNYRLRIRFNSDGDEFTNSCSNDSYYSVTLDYTLNIDEWREPYPPEGIAEPCGDAGFESGNYDAWEVRTGYHDNSINYWPPDDGCCNSTITDDYGLNADPWSGSRHTLVTAGVDPVTNIIPRVSPWGGTYSVRIGNAAGGGEADRLQMTFRVNEARPNFSFSYALVLNEPGHTIPDQPYFEASVYDANGRLIPCSRFQVTSNAGVNGFVELGNSVYKDWERLFVNLYDFIGQDVTVVMTVADCAQGAHYAYAYIDAECEPLGVEDYNPTVCRGEDVTISAPDGNGDFVYEWSTGDTTREITVTPTADTNIYIIRMTPPNGCPLELVDTVFVVDPIQVSQPQIFCNDDNTYTVAFFVTGGQPDTYTVDGMDGDFTKNGETYEFVSVPLSNADSLIVLAVTDTNDCSPVEYTLEHTCPTVCKAYPYVNTGADTKICMEDSYTINDAQAFDLIDLLPLSDTSKVGFGWIIKNGNGTLDDTASLSPTYQSTIDDAGDTVRLYLIGLTGSLDPRLCPVAVDSIDLIVERQPSVIAGDDGEICSADVFTVTNSDTLLASGFIWNTNGDGYLENDSTITPIYHPVQSDFDNDSVLLFLSAIAKSPCVNVQDTLVIKFTEDAIANAGNDELICVSDTLIHSGLTSGGTPLWTTTGAGELQNSDSIVFSYIPDLSDAGDTLFFILQSDADDPCLDAFDTLKVIVTPEPTFTIGIDARICGTSFYEVTDATYQDAQSILWSHLSSGTLQNATEINPIYSPGIGDYGKNVVLFSEITAFTPCTNIKGSLEIEVLTPPFVEAGDSTSVCAGSSVPVLGSIVIGDSIAWTHSGDGEVLVQDSIVVYNAALEDASKVIWLYLTAYGDLLCAPVMDSLPIFVAEPLLVEAGTGANVCKAGTYTIPDASTTNANRFIWKHNGAGLLSDTSTLSPTYAPGTVDIDKEITIYLEAIADDPCFSVIDSVVLTITGNAWAEGGNPIIICAGDEGVITDASAYGYSQVSWSTIGPGTLDQSSEFMPSYLSGSDEGGTVVQLILLADADDPCLDDTDTVDIQIIASPSVNVGVDTFMCYTDSLTFTGTTIENSEGIEWTHNGTGKLLNRISLTPRYVASPADAGKIIQLYATAFAASPCQNALDSVQIKVIDVPLVNAGTPLLACEEVPAILQGAFISNAVGFEWTHDGGGTLSSGNSLNPIYTPLLGEAGDTIRFTLTALAETPCSNQSAIVEMIIIEAPIINAGSDATICLGESYQINDANGDRYSSLRWTNNGDGIIINNGTLEAKYIPGIDDAGKDVTLTIVADPLSPCVQEAIDNMIITVLPGPVVDVEKRTTICQGDTYTLQASASNYSGFTWTVLKGSGQLSNGTTLTPTYVSTPEDIGEVVKIEIEVQGNGSCPPIKELVKIRVIASPISVAGDPADICVYDLYTFDAFVDNAAEFIWSHTGTGILVNDQSVTPTYRPSYEDRNKVVEFTLTAKASRPCTDDAISKTYLRISPEPGVYAGWDRTICAGEKIEFKESSAANYLDLEWEIIGGDVSKLENGVNLAAAYETDIAEGGNILRFVLHANPLSPCTEEATDTLIVVVEVIPEFELTDGNICPGQSYLIEISPLNVYPVNSYDWYTDSIGGQLIHTGEVFNVSPSKTIQYWVGPSRGCKGARVPVVVNVHPEPVAFFMSDTTLIEEQSVLVPFVDSSENTATGTWTWGDGEVSSYVPGEEIEHLYFIEVGQVPDLYQVQLDVVSDQGCTDSYVIQIPVKLRWNLFVPNAFSPNGDGINDGFRAKGFGIHEYEMLIFNRWGDLIFEGDELGDAWDGRDHIIENKVIIRTDEAKKVDTYVYKIKILNIFGERLTYRGEVNLIR